LAEPVVFSHSRSASGASRLQHRIGPKALFRYKIKNLFSQRSFEDTFGNIIHQGYGSRHTELQLFSILLNFDFIINLPGMNKSISESFELDKICPGFTFSDIVLWDKFAN
jgi:hypothetical protein